MLKDNKLCPISIIIHCTETASPSQSFQVVKINKKLFKNITLQIPKLILPNRMLISFPICCTVNFETVVSALNNTRKNRKRNYTILETIYYLLNKTNFKIWRVKSLKGVLPLKILEWTSGFRAISTSAYTIR